MKEYVIEVFDRNDACSLLSQKGEVLKFKSRKEANEFAKSELKNIHHIRFWTILSLHSATLKRYFK